MHQRRNRMVHTIDFVIPVVEKWREKEMGPLGGICQIHSGVELCAEYIYRYFGRINQVHWPAFISTQELK